ncbi:MAG: hypothetical protein G3M70_17600 [Candidatus Nitronauta litoralis]|uniref:Uncharacterized protein n=1 Tax=Candidatus Nitronauta litoralis TaxID=2705533 RepID=A0A7T0BZ40_9BACT|nr:MAG: hypothetical protein G3M70_17600 [Candidatus Nitronauta litoralis]
MKYVKMYLLIVAGFIALIGVRSVIRQENLYLYALDNITSYVLWSLAAFAFLVTREQRNQ